MSPRLKTGEIIKKYRVQFFALRPVRSQAVGETVYFNARGFKHLVFKGKHRRPSAAIVNRLVLIPLVAPTIRNCDEVVETRIRKEIIDGKKVQVTYQALEAHVGKDSIKVKVVVRKVGTRGKYFFYSIMKY